MKKKGLFRRVTACLLALTLVFSLLPCMQSTVYASENTTKIQSEETTQATTEEKTEVAKTTIESTESTEENSEENGGTFAPDESLVYETTMTEETSELVETTAVTTVVEETSELEETTETETETETVTEIETETGIELLSDDGDDVYKGHPINGKENTLEIEQYEMAVSDYNAFDAAAVTKLMKDNYSDQKFDVIRINAIWDSGEKSFINLGIYNAVLPYLNYESEDCRIEYIFGYNYGGFAEKGYFVLWEFYNPSPVNNNAIDDTMIDAVATEIISDKEVKVRFDYDNTLKDMASNVRVQFISTNNYEENNFEAVSNILGKNENDFYLFQDNGNIVPNSKTFAHWWVNSSKNSGTLYVKYVQYLESGNEYSLKEKSSVGYVGYVSEESGTKIIEIDEAYVEEGLNKSSIETILNGYDKNSFDKIYLYALESSNNVIQKDVYNTLINYVKQSDNSILEYNFYSNTDPINYYWTFKNPTGNSLDNNVNANIALNINDGAAYITIPESYTEVLSNVAASVNVNIDNYNKKTDMYDALYDMFGATADSYKEFGLYADGEDEKGTVKYLLDSNGFSFYVVNAEKLADATYQVQDSTPYNLTVVIGENSKTYTYRKASKVTIKLQDTDIPTGKQFKNWTVTGDANLSSTTSKTAFFTMPAGDVTITANFEAIPTGLEFELDKNADLTYTGKAITPSVAVTCNGKNLTAGTDYTLKYSNNINASTENKKASVTVTGVGNYSFSHTETFSIQPRNINDVTAGSIVITSGSKVTPSLVYNGQKLSAGKDYTINDANKKFTENGTIKVTGKGNYTEKRDITVTVKSKEELKKIGTVEIKLTGGVKNYTYNGNEQKLASVIVYDSTDKNKMTPLAESTDGIEGDYLVSYSSNTKDAGKVTVTVVGTGEYTGTVTKTYTISPLALKTSITANIVDKENITYNSTGVTLGENLTVSYDGKDLIEGKDYKVSYSNNKKASSQAKYTVTFQGNYKGSAKLTDSFTINKAELSPQDVQVVAADKVYSKPNVYKSTPYVTVDGVTLKASEYTVKYYTDSAYTEEMDSKNNRINLGSSKTSQPVYVEIDFDKKNGNYTGKAYGTYNVTRKAANDIDISKSKITVLDGEGNKIAKLNYTGYGLTPTLKIEVKKGTTYETIDKSDYYKYFDIQYINNVNKGKATILINAISGSGYTGSKTATFSIVVNKK